MPIISDAKLEKQANKIIAKTNKIQRNSRFGLFKKNFDFSTTLFELNSRLNSLNSRVLGEMLEKTRKDYDFMTWFNDEMYFRHIFDRDGVKLSENEAQTMFFKVRFLNPTHLFSKNNFLGQNEIGLTRRKYVSGFISLCAFAYYGLTLRDIFTSDGVFDLSPTSEPNDARKIDRIKQEAANDVFFMFVYAENYDFTEELLLRLGYALKEVAVPENDPDNFELLVKNYPEREGLAMLAETFLDAMRNIVLVESEKSEEFKTLISHAQMLTELRF